MEENTKEPLGEHPSGTESSAQTTSEVQLHVSALVSSRTHQNLEGVQLFDLVPAQVQVRQVGTFLSQCVQTSGNDVITNLQL